MGRDLQGGCKNPSTSHTGRVMSSDEELPPLTADRAGCDTTRIAFEDLINSPPRPRFPKLCEPRIEPPLQRGRKQQRRIALFNRTHYPCALTPLSKWTEGTKAQIDCLERMLHSAMPPRVQLDNAFTGLRNSVADDIETAIEDQWKAGVKHGQYAARMQVPTLEAVKASPVYCQLENEMVQLLVDKAALERQLNSCRQALSYTGAQPFEEESAATLLEDDAIRATVAENSELCSSLGAFLAGLPIPDSRPSSPVHTFQDPQIDLDALVREITSIEDIISCAA